MAKPEKVTGLAPVAGLPRLLREQDAAAYLSLPNAAMRRIRAGRVIVDGRVRWDRQALDAWLDRESGISATTPASEARTAAEDLLDGWLANAPHAARRP